MTRPMTKTELALMASSLAKHNERDPFIRFIIDKMMLGAGTGTMFAAVMLLTDAFGMSSLLRDVTDPFGHIVAFLVGGVMIFTPLTLAVAVGLAPRSK
jgi:hypothetical protein